MNIQSSLESKGCEYSGWHAQGYLKLLSSSHRDGSASAVSPGIFPTSKFPLADMVVSTTLTVKIDAASVAGLGQSSYVLRVGRRPDAVDPFSSSAADIPTDPPDPSK